MRFAFVLANSADLFPKKCHGIETNNVCALIPPEQNHVEHFNKHIRIAVIEIPLVIVEHRHHPTLHFVAKGEVAGRGFGKDLRHGLLEHVRYLAIVIGVVILLIPCVADLGLHRPRMFVRGVVDDHIQR